MKKNNNDNFQLNKKVLEHGRQIDGYRGQEPPADFIPVCVVQSSEQTVTIAAHNQTKVRELMSPYDYRPKAWWYVPKAEALKEGPEELKTALEF